MITIQPHEVALFAALIQERTGIVVGDDKAYLLENRLAPLLEEAGADSFTDFLHLARHSGEWGTRLIDAITTNETSFFRDQRPFALLQTRLLPELLARRQQAGEPGPPRLHVWSAACATGQEAYSVGMLISEALGPELTRWDIQILGTDISHDVIARASQGRYSRFEVDRGVPPHLRERYFEAQGDRLHIRPQLRAITTFRTANLLAAPDHAHQFDIVFCRNVGIYFNETNRRRLFTRIAHHLRPDGVLFIGATESLFGVCDCFIRHECQHTAYFERKPESPP